MRSDLTFESLAEEFVELQEPGISLQKELYAHFGLTFYSFAVLEHGIITAVQVSRLLQQVKKGKIKSRQEWELAFDREGPKVEDLTFGNLVREIVLVREFQDLQPALEKAKKNRDYFAHRLFREEIEYFSDPEVAKRLLVQIAKTRLVIQELDAACDERFHRIVEKYRLGFPVGAELDDLAKRLAADGVREILGGKRAFGWEP